MNAENSVQRSTVEPNVPAPADAPVAPAAESPRYDIFLSHNSRDKPLVERLAARLKRAGLEPWLDKWNLTPGGRWQDEIVDGLRGSSACAVFVGPHGMGDWVREELAVALDRAAKDRGFRLFLVLLPGVPEPFDPTTLPPFLSTRTWVDLRAGIDAAHALQSLINAVRGVAHGPSTTIQPDAAICPYRGLEAFDEDSAEFFFGRESDIQRLLEQLRESRFLAVLGASGTGKSSLVRAGLVPALRTGRLPESDRWPVRVFKPGARPLVELAACLTRLEPDLPGGMQRTLDGLESDQRTLDLATALVLAGQPPETQLVLVVDQFEEAFTLCQDEQERGRFFENLLYAARAPGGRTVVVLTMRADFYPRCAAWPELAQQIARNQYLVSPMDDDGLRQAIVEPAFRVGLQFEEGLVETILADVERQPGALPLLEHALLQLWEQRAGVLLTLEAYRRIGGVSGALARRADEIYSGFTTDQREMTRRVLLRLTQPGEGTEDTRRRATLHELESSAQADASLDAVVQTLVGARLLTVDGDVAGADTLDVAHEALIRGWPRLRGWIDEDRAGLREHRRITDAALEWERLGRDDSSLFRGARLTSAREWRGRHEADLNPLERSFLDSSEALVAHERRAARRRQQLTVAGLSLALLVIAVAAIVAFTQRDAARDSARQAERERDVAAAAGNLAFSRELSANSLSTIDDDPQLSLLLALEAVHTQETDETLETLRQVLLETPIHSLVSPNAILSPGAALSPDGTLVATGDSSGNILLWETATGNLLATMPGHQVGVPVLQFSPDGTLLATGDRNGEVRIWDVAMRESRFMLTGHTDQMRLLTFNRSGSLLLSAGVDGHPRIWNTTTGELVSVLGDGDGITSIATFSDDERFVIVKSEEGIPASWDPTTGEKIVEFSNSDADIYSAVAIPNTNQVLCAGFYVTLRIWDVETGTLVRTISNDTTPYAEDAQITPDGTRVVLVGLGGYAGIWDTATWSELHRLIGHRAVVVKAYISPDGRYAATTSFEGFVRVWDMQTGEQIALLRGHQELVAPVIFSATGPQIVTAASDSQVLVYSYAALNASRDELLALAADRNTRDFTPEERARYLHQEPNP